MKNTLHQTYQQLEIPHFYEAFCIIDEVLHEFEIPSYLIGSTAMAFHFLNEGYALPSLTKDIDFAILIGEIADFDRITDALNRRGFRSLKIPWTVYHAELGVVVDIMPFGEFTNDDVVPFGNHYDLRIIGFREALSTFDRVLIEDKTALIPPLSGLVLLKMLAWSDRPEHRQKDLDSILDILLRYFDFRSDAIYEEHFDLFPENDAIFDTNILSAKVLGREIRILVGKSDKLTERIEQILEAELASPVNSIWLRHWANKKDWTLDYVTEVLSAFRYTFNKQPSHKE